MVIFFFKLLFTALFYYVITYPTGSIIQNIQSRLYSVEGRISGKHTRIHTVMLFLRKKVTV